MANLLTYSWVGTNGDEWIDGYWSQRAGSATEGPLIQSNAGHMPTASGTGDRTLQSKQRLTARNHKVKLTADWANAVSAGDWFGLHLRLTDDGDTSYWAKLDSNTNVPTLTLYRRRGGTDTSLTSVDLTGLTGSQQVLGTDLNAGVTVWMRVETEASQVNVKVGVDKANAALLDNADFQIDYDDTASTRIDSGGTWGIEIDGNASGTDIVLDDFVAMDFEDEADPIPNYAEGFSMRINGNYFDEDTLVEMGLQTVEVLQSYASGGGQIEARLMDINDFHRPMFRAGDEVEILFDGEHYARGIVRPTSHNVTAAGDQNSYEVYGPKMLARDVVLRDPDSNLGTLTYNLDAEHPQYDPDLADMTLGEILQDVVNKHAEGEDGIRAKRAGPADAGTDIIDSIPTEMMTGPIFPAFAVSGNIVNAVETILHRMPKFAWRIAPDTLVWHLDERPTATVEELRTSEQHMTWKFGVKAQLARTVVFVRGGEPEVQWSTLSIGTGDIETAWNTALGLESESYQGKAFKNTDSGTVAGIGVGNAGDGPYLDGHLYVDTSGFGSMVENEWYFARLHFDDGNQQGNQYTIIESDTNGRLWLSKESTWYTGGSPSVSDSIRITGMRGEKDPEGMGDGAENIWADMWTAYKTTNATDLASGRCSKARVTYPNAEGGSSIHNIATAMTPGRNTNSGQTFFQTSSPTLIPLALINTLPGSRQAAWGSVKACANIGGVDGNIGDFEVDIPVPQTSVPFVREPEEGFRGSAFAEDVAKHDGAGEPGVGDAAVTTPLVVDDPGFQYQSLQESEYRKMASAMLDIWGELPRMADVRIENVWHTDFRELNRRVTILDDNDPDGGRENYADLDSLLLVQAKWRWTPEGVSTEINCGTLNTLSGVNMDAIRRLHVDTSEQKRLKEQMKLMEEMHNCLKEQAGFAASAIAGKSNSPTSGCNVTYNHATAGRPGRPGAAGKPGPGGGVQKKLNDIEDILQGIFDDLTWKQPGTFWLNDNVDGNGGSGMMWTDPDGQDYEYNPDDGDWDPVDVDPDSGETTPNGNPAIPGPPGWGGPNGVGPGGPFLGPQKGFGSDKPFVLNADGTNDPTHVSNNGPSPGLTAPFVDPSVTKPTGGVDRIMYAYSVPLANGGAGELYYQYQGDFYLDGGDEVANPGGGGDDTLVAGNPLDPDNDGFPENLLGGYEGYLFQNKHVMEHRLLGAQSGATTIPSNAEEAGDYRPGQTDFEGTEEFRPVYDVRDMANAGYEAGPSNSGLANMKAGGLVGNALGALGFTEDGKGVFASGPGSRLDPGDVVGSDGAYYYSPSTGGATAGQPDVITLTSGHTVPANLFDILVEVAALSGLDVSDDAAPMGVIWTDGTNSYVVEPGAGNGFRQIEAASGGPGTGINGGDWQWVATPAYFVPTTVTPAISVHDATGAVGLPGAPVPVPMDTVQGNTTGSGMSLVTGHVNVLNPGKYLARYTVTAFDSSVGVNLPDGIHVIMQYSPTGAGTWVNVNGADSYGEVGALAGGQTSGRGEAMLLVPSGGWDVRVIASSLGATPSMTTVALASSITIERVE